MIADPDAAARRLGSIVLEAGRFLAQVRDRGAGRVVKPDGSPSTAADLEAERMILGRLAADFPDIPVVAEESAEAASAPSGLYFLVDPLDGTRDYLTGAGEYSVNAALIAGDRPIAAALAVPVLGRVWAAGTTCLVAPIPPSGDCTDWQPTAVRPSPAEGPVAVVSRRHGDDATDICLDRMGIGGRRIASSAAKFGLIASGEADVYVRCGATMEWDTAAGDHVVTVAGGLVLGADGKPLTYGHAERGFLNGAFAAFGDRRLAGLCTLPAG
ncbi:3'(2'),5'-bisphosphate nucleotidase CysQ family protein [Enterovirga rhinocerotis]|uniref:3'(2'),5-bisphosphonucleoside 3'(2')-phosphohydrolase n=1 Tax=Enterovirga rhinocerotis TaxID=1339210 RepID=A0A4R7C4F0_9HYPH|nr:3'(2'),5'-bisphosphate nucleotidase CysQ [Enterovirga rhinocerotis]TDR93410.1 3'(2'),5'-bisphosphate nucleotidase [Enterovirga rhinocerotis]